MDQAGLVLLAVAGLWIAYLVPHRLRYRQELLESRAEDRFSDGLRVLRVAHAGTGTRGATPARKVGAHGPADRPHVLIHPGGPRGGGGHMNRPHAARDRVVADAVRATAEQHARRAAHLARRRAAARRRAVLTLVLLVATAAAWVAVGAVSASLLVGAVPTTALAGVLLLGRRAVVAAARADAAWAAGAADRVPLPGARRAPSVTGRAVHPSDAQTEVIARVRGAEARVPQGARAERAPATTQATAMTTGTAPRTAAGRPAASADASSEVSAAATTASGTDPGVVPPMAEPGDGVDEPSWVPVPVPRPTYTLKPSARRPEPAPLLAGDLAGGGPAEAAGTDETASTTAASTTAAATATPESTPVAPGAATPSGAPPLDLDAILERRRASGE